jgi:hypothetical protein
MELLSGYSDNALQGFNGYTPQANAAIANNNNAYWANQAAMAAQAQAAQNNVFASGGGFGAQTNYYSGLGAAYGRATGGFNGSAPGWADPQPQQQPAYDPNQYNESAGLNMDYRGGAPIDDALTSYWSRMYGGDIGSTPKPAPNLGLGYDPSAAIRQTPQPMLESSGNSFFNPSTYPASQYGVPQAMPDIYRQLGYIPDQLLQQTQQQQAQPQQPAYDPNQYNESAGLNMGYRGGAPIEDALTSYWSRMYGGGGYNPYDPSTYAAAAQGNVGRGFPTSAQAPSPGYDPNAAIQNSFAGRYPEGMSPSIDVEAQRQQGIQDLMRTLGMVDQALGTPYGGAAPQAPQAPQGNWWGAGTMRDAITQALMQRPQQNPDAIQGFGYGSVGSGSGSMDAYGNPLRGGGYIVPGVGGNDPFNAQMSPGYGGFTGNNVSGWDRSGTWQAPDLRGWQPPTTQGA